MRAWLIVVLLVASTAAGAQQGGWQATLRALDGVWAGPGHRFAIDLARMQVQIDPEKPFVWEPLTFQSIEGAVVMFAVGSKRYAARVDAGRLLLTRLGYPGELALRKVRRTGLARDLACRLQVRDDGAQAPDLLVQAPQA